MNAKQLTKANKHPLKWSTEQHDADFCDFLSKYVEQLKKEENNDKPGLRTTICGEEDWVETQNIDINSPVLNRATCSLAITRCDGSRSLCSGFFIGPRKVVTAAHCLFHEVWADRILVRPGLYRDDSGTLYYPFQGDYAVQALVPKKWCDREPHNFDYDWGLITLESEELYNRAGNPSFELWAPSNDDLTATRLHFAAVGYPVFEIGDPPNIGQFRSTYEGMVGLEEFILTGRQDFISGNSGGPLVEENGERVIGITSHQYPECSRPNGFTRITEEVIRNIEGVVPGSGGTINDCDHCG